MNLLAHIGVEPDERRLFVWAGLCLLILGAASTALQNTAETLFLKRVGVDYLPIAFLICSIILVGGTAAVGRLLSTVDRPRWLPWLLSLLGLTLVPVWGLVYSQSQSVLWALLVLVELLEAIGLLAYWVALGDLVTPRQAKRLFAPLAAGTTIGRLLGSFATQPASLLVGIEGIVLIAAGLHGFAALAGLALARSAAADHEAKDDALGASRTATATPAARRRGPRIGRMWAESRLFRLLAIWSFCAGTLGPMVYFQFSYAVNLATAGENGEQALLALYSQFRGWLYLAILVTQLGLSARIYRRFGIPLTAAFWPLSFLGGFVWLGLSLQLRAALGTISAIRVEGNAIAKPGVKILHNLLPDRMRSAAISWAEGPISHVGGAVGNGLVLGVVGIWGASAVSAPAIPIALVWCGAAFLIWRLYPSLLLQAASDHNLKESGVEMADLLDPATLRALASDLISPDPDICRATTELIESAEPAQAAGILVNAIEVAQHQMRPLLTDALQRILEKSPPGTIRNSAAAETLGRLLAEPQELAPDQRADLLQVFARLTGGRSPVPGSDAVLDAALGDPEAAARLAAMAELQRRGHAPPGVRDLDEAVAGAFARGGVLMRRTARKELRATLIASSPDEQWRQRVELLAEGLSRRVDRAGVAEVILELARRHGAAAACCAEAMLVHLDDPDPRVRAPVLAYVGNAKLVGSIDALVERLGSRDEIEAQAAQEGLVAFGERSVEPLLRAFRFDDGLVGDRILLTLQNIGVDSSLLCDLQVRAVEALRDNAIRMAALWSTAEEGPTTHLVLRRLQERVDEELRTALALLAAVEVDPRLAQVANELYAAVDPHQRAILVEAIESVLTRKDARELLPLMETKDPRALGAVAAAQRGVLVPSPEQAWAELEEDRDELLQSLRSALMPPWLEVAGSMADTSAMSSMETMQIAAFLQRVPGFERLSTRQLVRVARTVVEVSIGSGETLFAEGEEGTVMYVLVEGAVCVSAGGRELDRLGVGALLGELSTLDGDVRSETVVALEDCLALRLDRTGLLALMSEAPGLGIGLSQVLALRLRTLQRREEVT